MKKLIQKLLVVASGLFVYTSSVLAQSTNNSLWQADGNNLAAPSKDTLGGSITTLINYALGILGLIAVAFVIYAGVLMVTSAGNEEATNKAKKTITWAAIGIVIVILSYSIVRFITGALG